MVILSRGINSSLLTLRTVVHRLVILLIYLTRWKGDPYSEDVVLLIFSG